MKTINLTDIDNSLGKNLFDNFIRVDNIYIASKITSLEQVNFIKSLDIKLAVDLKDTSEVDFSDKKSFEKENIEYIHFPITDIQSLNFERLSKFSHIINKDDSKKLIYCLSGNRVGALLALYACFICGHPKQRAYDFGKVVGMTSKSMQKKIHYMIFNGVL